ncbi:MAG: hypothetical protein V2A54_13760 [Bacteroidota bacterium]
MKKFKVLTVLLCLSFTATIAQNEIHALKFSQLTFGGTAKYLGMGGAYGAQGGDFSVLSSNPAGIALYKKSEISFSPSFYISNSNSNYLGMSSEDNRFNFNLSNIGVVLTYPVDKENSWSNVNFGFGMNRLNNFNNRVDIVGINKTGSFVDQYLGWAQNTNYDNLEAFSTDLAWGTYLIDTVPGTTDHYFGAVNKYGEQQRKSIDSRGSQNEMVFSFGANYNEKFYIGGTLGIPYIRYMEESTYKEIDVADSIPGFKSFTLNENFNTTGSGVNFKFGMIFRPVDFVKLGVAIHSPSFYEMKIDYSKKLTTEFDSVSFDQSSPKGYFDYQLQTPFRAIGSIAIVFGKYGQVTADAEFVDYTEARFYSKDYPYYDENDAIRNNYNSQINLRAGTEWNAAPFTFRGGFAMYGSPYKSGLNDGSVMCFSGGIGYREEGYFIDVAYVLRKTSEDYYLYSMNTNAATIETLSHQIVWTLGFRF